MLGLIEGIWELCVLSAQFCCDSKTSLKIKVYFFKEREEKENDRPRSGSNHLKVHCESQRASADTFISFTHKDSWTPTQVPGLIVQVAMLPGGQVSEIKPKTFLARMGPEM